MEGLRQEIELMKLAEQFQMNWKHWSKFFLERPGHNPEKSEEDSKVGRAVGGEAGTDGAGNKKREGAGLEVESNDSRASFSSRLHFLNVFYDPRIIWEQRIAAKTRLNDVATFLAAAAEEKQKRGHVLSFLTMGRYKQLEYRGVANVVAETCWLRNLLREVHTPLSSTTLVYCDNGNLVATGQVRVLHVPSRYQYEDNFTKGFPSFSVTLIKL
ncbi:ribonuclease H-like domain-containing protein [Tanacetum coccineum]